MNDNILWYSIDKEKKYRQKGYSNGNGENRQQQGIAD